MSLKRRPPAVQRDPAVEATLSEGARREKRRSMTPAQRKKADADAARVRINIALGPEITGARREEAAELGVPMANLAKYRLAESINRARSSSEDLRNLLKPATGGSALRFPFELPIPELVEKKDGVSRGQWGASSDHEMGWGSSER